MDTIEYTFDDDDPRLRTILLFLEDYERDLRCPESEASWPTHEHGARELLARLEGKDREVPQEKVVTKSIEGVEDAWKGVTNA